MIRALLASGDLERKKKARRKVSRRDRLGEPVKKKDKGEISTSPIPLAEQRKEVREKRQENLDVLSRAWGGGEKSQRGQGLR